MPGISPYSYCADNPINYIDEFGLSPDDKPSSNSLDKRHHPIPHPPRPRIIDKIRNLIIRLFGGLFDLHGKYIANFNNGPAGNQPATGGSTQVDWSSFGSIKPISAQIPNKVNPELNIDDNESQSNNATNLAGENNPTIEGHITFNMKSYNIDLNNEANTEFLDKLIVTLKAYPDMILVISCNTADESPNLDGIDNTGTYIKMAHARAMAIIKYLRSKGVKNSLTPGNGKHYKGGDDKRTTLFKSIY